MAQGEASFENIGVLLIWTAAAYLFGRWQFERSLSVDVLAVSAWLVLGFLVAPILGLAPATAVAIVCFAVLLLGIFVFVLGVGRWQTTFLRTVTWPVTWSSLAALFAFIAFKLILYP